MNRAMLLVVGALVLVGIVVFLVSGPSVTDRIANARSCTELADIRNETGDMLNAEFAARSRQLGCL